MTMDDLDDWRLATALNVYEIALLIKGYNPSHFADEEIDHWHRDVKSSTHAIISTIKRSVTAKNISAQIVEYQPGNTDWDNTSIDVESVQKWLLSRGYTDFFFTQSAISRDSDFLDTESPFYAFKLDSAIKAWHFVKANPEAMRNKTPKTAIKDWLTANAKTLGLVKADGEINKTAIEEIASVANWDQAGGAPQTGLPKNQTSPQVRQNLTQIKSNPNQFRAKPPPRSTALDEDIPF